MGLLRAPFLGLMEGVMVNQFKKTIIHEIGHLVVGRAIGRKSYHLYADSDGEGSIGVFTLDAPGIRKALADYAGYWSEIRHGYSRAAKLKEWQLGELSAIVSFTFNNMNDVSGNDRSRILENMNVASWENIRDLDIQTEWSKELETYWPIIKEAAAYVEACPKSKNKYPGCPKKAVFLDGENFSNLIKLIDDRLFIKQ